jgi:hypothetical protein
MGLHRRIVACPLLRTKALPSLAIAVCTADPLALWRAAFVGIQLLLLPLFALAWKSLAAGDLVYGLCCPLPVKLQTLNLASGLLVQRHTRQCE